MTAELWFLLGIMGFWILLYAISRIFHLEKLGLDVRPAYFMFRSNWMKNFLDRISQNGQKFWKILASVGIVIAFGMMILAIYSLSDNLFRFLIPAGGASPVVPILPGITLQLYWLPYFFAAATAIILTHEFAHGIAARVEKVAIKSAGIMALFVFFGGFVELDEEEMEKARRSSKLRIISAGSSTNFATFLLVTLLLIGLFAPSSGVLIQEVVENGPAARAGLQQWDVVYAVNGTRMQTANDLMQYFEQHNITAGQKLIFSTYRENITITVGTNSSGKPSLGILYSDYYRLTPFETSPIITVNLYTFMNWLHLIAGSVAVLNMLPLYPFDGDKFVYYLLGKVVKKRLNEIRIFYNIVFLGLIALNIAFTLSRFGLVPI